MYWEWPHLKDAIMVQNEAIGMASHGCRLARKHMRDTLVAGQASLLFSLRIAAGSIWEITASLAPGSPLFLIAQSIRSIPGVALGTCLPSRLSSHVATCGLLIQHPTFNVRSNWPASNLQHLARNSW